jgi:hypothetical protein
MNAQSQLSMLPMHRPDEIKSGEQDVIDLDGPQEDEVIKIHSR